MKLSSILEGNIYHDGKSGLRQVLRIDGAPGCMDSRVRYKILAAKTDRELLADGKWKSLIGSESAMNLRSFCGWAKDGYSAQEGALVLLRLDAARVKLSPGEADFMRSVLAGFNRTPAAGTVVRHDSAAARTVHSLMRKGMVYSDQNFEFSITALGSARFAGMSAASESSA